MIDANIVGIDWHTLLSQVGSCNGTDITEAELTSAVIKAYKQIEEEKKSEVAAKKAKRLSELEEKVKRKQSGVKSNGVPIATGADPIRSYDDFKTIVDFLARSGSDTGKRNAAIFAVGCATGLRGSDVLRLKIEDVFNKDASYKDRIYLIEKKTGKYQEKPITEAIRHYLNLFLRDEDKMKCGFLFKSQMGNYDIVNSQYVRTDSENAVTPRYLSTVLKSAGEACGLPIHISAHTMRHSFACIAYKIANFSGRSDSLQSAMNHSNGRITDGYIQHVRREENDLMCKTVSDFLMGKLDRNLILWNPS